MRAELILYPEPGEAVGGSLVAEVEDVRVVRDGVQELLVAYLETCVRRAAAARLEREPTGHPLIVYVRADQPAKPTPRGS